MTTQWDVPGGGRVDVALGEFRKGEGNRVEDRVLVMVELKGPGADLDRQGSSTRSAVQQAWGYLNASPTARWAIVSNAIEIRLYSRDRTSNHVHRVAVEDLEDKQAFAEFFAVFHADGLLGTAKLALNATALLDQTILKQETVSEKLYEDYRDHRMMLIEEIRSVRDGLSLDDVIASAQKLLDRILFIAFAEARDLLFKRNINVNLIEATAGNLRAGSTRWRAFQDLFHAFDVGDFFFDIPRFNGELFKPDPILDAPDFQLDDDRWPTFFTTVAGYDFKHEVTVEVLGVIFEQSITDLEDIRRRGLDAHRADLDERKKSATRARKRTGVFYTHPAITGYLVSAALDPAWDSNRVTLMATHSLPDDAPGAFALPSMPLAAYVRDRLAWLDGLKVCDPACGSGAFLISAYKWFEARRCALLDDLKQAEPDAPEADGDRDEWIRRLARRSCGTTSTASTSRASRSRSPACRSGSKRPGRGNRSRTSRRTSSTATASSMTHS